MSDAGDTGQRSKADELADYGEQLSTGILREFWEFRRYYSSADPVDQLNRPG